MIPQRSNMTWNLLLLTWLVALVSTLSALFIGEVMGQAPCVLCWFQRAFMFPLAVILAIASYRSDFTVWRYALPLTADSTPFGHSAHADPDTCSTLIRTGSRSAATQGWHC